MQKTRERARSVLIAGAGPAGSSLSIRLARAGHKVTLIEKDKFPRHKLCGEFISPECLRHFRELGVERSLTSSGGDRISRTVFYPEKGRGVEVPSEWLGSGVGGALGLSRALMDQLLIERARSSGVHVLENGMIRDLKFSGGRIVEAEVCDEAGETGPIAADAFVDATGRSRVLAGAAEKSAGVGRRSAKRRWVAFKTHLDGVRMEDGRCEIYFFRGGYGGLSYVENGAANHCFLIRSDVVRESKGNPEDVFRNIVLANERASSTMGSAQKRFDWLAVSIDRFGSASPPAASNLYSVGDAAAFIDPFTGSGMLLALESAELLACYLSSSSAETEASADRFHRIHRRRFYKRLAVCGVMRRLSFSPSFANLAITALRYGRPFRKGLARATRFGSARNPV